MTYFDERRRKLIEVFEDTARRCECDGALRDAVTTAREGTRFIPAAAKLPQAEHHYTEPCVIKVTRNRSFEAAKAYTGRVCVLNFASAATPGGGVTNGAGAQEECLCRCSTLYSALNTTEMWNEFYERHRTDLQQGRMTDLFNDDCIYTPGVAVFKSDTQFPQPLPQAEWFTVDVITCAAPRLHRSLRNGLYEYGRYETRYIDAEELRKLHAICSPAFLRSIRRTRARTVA